MQFLSLLYLFCVLDFGSYIMISSLNVYNYCMIFFIPIGCYFLKNLIISINYFFRKYLNLSHHFYCIISFIVICFGIINILKICFLIFLLLLTINIFIKMFDWLLLYGNWFLWWWFFYYWLNLFKIFIRSIII